MEKKRKQEWRFAIANREAWIGCALAVINFVWWFGFAYGLGSKPPEEYTYILGFPAWIFFSLIFGTLFMFALVFFVVKFMLTEISLEDEEVEDTEDEVRDI